VKKPLILTLIFVALGAMVYFYNAYNKEHTDVSTADVLQELTTSDLFAAFDADVALATEQYAEQVITVSGSIYSIDLENEKEPQIVLQANGDDGFIRCGFATAARSQVESLQEYSNIKIKGLCKGMNDAGDLDLLAERDVILSDCIIID
jgi:hypothetical protein